MNTIPENDKSQLDFKLAMFNCHINNGLEKTCTMFKEIWGEHRFDKIIKPIIEKGVMSVFRGPKNKHTIFFVFYNMDVVNGKR